jgi:hypothetical protein
MSSADRSVVRTLAADPKAGTLSGPLNEFAVAGTWAPGVANQNAPAFNLSGADDLKVTFVAAVGVISGSTDAPTGISIWITESSSSTGSVKAYNAVLSPTPTTRKTRRAKR